MRTIENCCLSGTSCFARCCKASGSNPNSFGCACAGRARGSEPASRRAPPRPGRRAAAAAPTPEDRGQGRPATAGACSIVTGGADNATLTSARAMSKAIGRATFRSGSTYQGAAAGRTTARPSSSSTAIVCRPSLPSCQASRPGKGGPKSSGGESSWRQRERPVATIRCISRSTRSGFCRERRRRRPQPAAQQPQKGAVVALHVFCGRVLQLLKRAHAVRTPAARFQNPRNPQIEDKGRAGARRAIEAIDDLLGRRRRGCGMRELVQPVADRPIQRVLLDRLERRRVFQCRQQYRRRMLAVMPDGAAASRRQYDRVAAADLDQDMVGPRPRSLYRGDQPLPALVGMEVADRTPALIGPRLADFAREAAVDVVLVKRTPFACRRKGVETREVVQERRPQRGKTGMASRAEPAITK